MRNTQADWLYLTANVQRADGTYVGTLEDMVIDAGSSDRTTMTAFDSAGNFQWSTGSSYYPEIATADGGVIAETATGTHVTFDQNGRATGQLASLPTKSLTGELYLLGSIDDIFDVPYFEAPSFEPQAGSQTRIPVDSPTNKAVSDILTTTMWQRFSKSNCAKVFGDPRGVTNFSVDTIQKKQKMTNFYLLDNPGIGNLTVSAVTGGYIPSTARLENQIGTAYAQTINRGYDRQTAVVLRNGFFSLDTVKFTLVHEVVLHAFWGQTDDQIFGNTFFAASGLWRENESTATATLTSWIGTDCKCTPEKPGQQPPCSANTAPW